MRALENNFAFFANNNGDHTFAIFTPGPLSPGDTVQIAVGLKLLGQVVASTVVSVTVKSVTDSHLVFSSDPGHVLYPATVTFSAQDAGNGQVTFTTAVDAQTNGELGTIEFLTGGKAGETNTWNHLLEAINKLCGN
jgi:hypothetical protein